MITLQQSGQYRLVETRQHTKILYLGDDAYAWVEPRNIGEILVVSHHEHPSDWTLSIGHYRIYDVLDEPNLSDLLHLELEVGNDIWQGYLLLTGLPDDTHKRKRIIPTHELITHGAVYARRNRVPMEKGAA